MTEFKTLTEAKELHPECEVFDIIERMLDTSHPDYDDFFPETRPAIWIWENEIEAQDSDGSNCVAIYWEKEV